jgi:hypothetical protein
MKRTTIKQLLMALVEGLAIAVLLTTMTVCLLFALSIIPMLLVKTGQIEYAVVALFAELLLIYTLYVVIVITHEDTNQTTKQSDNE